ncbi:MAG: metallopeptidase family protein [Ignavibacteriales bacterium]|nr:metallopeptidase family protein [Ignavibacteriales bacterium]
MDRSDFEKIVEQAFEKLPEKFKQAVENVGIIVEDYPNDEIVQKMNLPSKRHLLGLYQGIPFTHRGSWYGMTPVVPDKISLYQMNIESISRTEEDIERKIIEVLIHEIGHYFGMSEDEIREAGY